MYAENKPLCRAVIIRVILCSRFCFKFFNEFCGLKIHLHTFRYLKKYFYFSSNQNLCIVSKALRGKEKRPNPQRSSNDWESSTSLVNGIG